MKMLVVACIFMVCSIVICATKYKSEAMEWFGLSDGEQAVEYVDANTANEDSATETDAETEVVTETSEEDAEASAEPDATPEEDSTENTSETTEEVTTEEVTTEEPTTEYVNASLEYISTKNVDTTDKGDDWYDEDLYDVGCVTDDEYFSTALFIGDSRTEGLSLYSGLDNLTAYFSKGLNIEKVLTDEVVETEDGDSITVLEALAIYQYDNIYISFGLNELGWAFDYLFIEAYQTFIDQVKELQPNATIYIQNILPVSAELSKEDEIYNNKNVRSFNKLIKAMCQDYGDVIYLDVGSSVAENGVLPADASTDGRHCNAKYCAMWLNYIRNNVYVRKE